MDLLPHRIHRIISIPTFASVDVIISYTLICTRTSAGHQLHIRLHRGAKVLLIHLRHRMLHVKQWLPFASFNESIYFQILIYHEAAIPLQPFLFLYFRYITVQLHNTDNNDNGCHIHSFDKPNCFLCELFTPITKILLVFKNQIL